VEDNQGQPRWRGAILPSNVDLPQDTQRQPTWRAVQNPWLVAALVIATFNLYALWWLGRTWWQLKQEDNDHGKHPVWHALAMLVPFYGYFRFHAHMRTIAELARTPDAKAAVSPGPMTTAWIVINVLSATALRSDVPGWVDVLASILSGALLGWAQYGLNTVWRSLPGGTVRARLHPVHLLLLVVGIGLLMVALFVPEQ
jgi:hypothetical protein